VFCASAFDTLQHGSCLATVHLWAPVIVVQFSLANATFVSLADTAPAGTTEPVLKL